MEQNFNIIQEYSAILKRYIYYILIIVVLGFGLSIIISKSLPSIYKSTATILIEPRGLPKNIVMSLVTDYAEQRIQIINKKIMSSANLIKIINKFNLYPEKQIRGNTITSIVSSMRSHIEMDLIGGEGVYNQAAGRMVKPTLAFSLSFENESPQIAQQVVSELVDLYLQENKEQRIEVVEGATTILERETDKLTEEINILESKLARFKEINSDNLPGMQQLNIGRLNNIEQELAALNIKISSLTESELFLKDQLMRLSPNAEDQLAQLYAEYAIAAAKYSENHPDIKRLKVQIATLEKDIKLPETNNEVARTQDYIQLQTRLIATRTELEESKKLQQSLQDKLSDYKERIAKAPQVEQEYQILTRDYENSLQRYRELKEKQREVAMAQTIETNKTVDEFSVLEPPSLPEWPSKPNRSAIKFLGILISIVLALGFIMIKEGIHPFIYTPGRLASIVGMAPLVIVPNLNVKQSVMKRKK